MELRDALKPPNLDEDRVDQLTELGHEIVECLEQGEDCSERIDTFNRQLGCVLGPAGFRHFIEHGGVREFIEKTLRGLPERLPDIDQEEAVEMVRRIAENEADKATTDYLLNLLDRHYPGANVSDLIFWEDGEMTPEQIVDRAEQQGQSAIQLGTAGGDSPQESAGTASAPQPTAEDRELAEELLYELVRRDLADFDEDGLELVEPLARIFSQTDEVEQRADAVSSRLTSTRHRSTPVAEVSADGSDLRELIREVQSS